MENTSSSRSKININPANWQIKDLARFNPKNWGTKEFFIFLFAMLFVGLAIPLSLSQVRREKSTQPSPTTAPQEQVFISPHTLVYGIWTEKSSLIKAYDLSVGKEYLLAELPKNIKKVTVFSPTELLFINNTNERDHGTEIVRYSLRDKTTQIIATALPGFGIDDYSISPNKRYFVYWEVSFAPGSTILLDGRSQIYSIDLSNPSQKYLIYNEVATQPIHYPRGVTNTGDIFFDTFLPNSGAAWAYGMSASDFQGINKQNLFNMQNGTYGTIPELSPDGRYLAFSGYDGKYGTGTATKDGFRQAVTTPNTIDLLDTQERNRIRLSNISNENVYPYVSWDKQTGNLIFLQISKSASRFYSYNLAQQEAQEIQMDESTPQTVPLGTLSSSKTLIGKPDISFSTLSNLGEAYSLSMTSFYVYDQNTSVSTELSLSSGLAQFITVTSSLFFDTTQLVPASSPNKQLQLKTFPLKLSLAPVRLQQQSTPLPQEFIPPPPIEAPPPIDGSPPESTEPPPAPTCDEIVEQHCAHSDESGCIGYATFVMSFGCTTTPLYLYGPSGENVEVKVHTSVYSSSPEYTTSGYNITLLSNGKMQIGGKEYNSITYDYIPARFDITAPSSGIVVQGEKLSEVLSFFSQNLGLNFREKQELIRYAKKNISSPYVFVSFFDEKTSKEILPLSFAPTPDTYINIVFYFKEFDNKPTFIAQTPVFPPVKARGEFTAVEVSWILDK